MLVHYYICNNLLYYITIYYISILSKSLDVKKKFIHYDIDTTLKTIYLKTLHVIKYLCNDIVLMIFLTR